MKKSILLFVVLLFSTISHAKFYKAILYMEDGTQKKGLAEIMKSEDSKVQFKTDEKASKEKIASTDIKKIEFFDENNNITIFEFLYVINPKIFSGKFSKSKKKVWFNIIYNKDVKIGYIYSVGSTSRSGGITYTNPSSTTYYFGMKYSDSLVFGYLDSLVAIGTDAALRKMAREAFVECPNLVEAIEKENFKLKNLMPTLISIFDKIKCK